MPHDIPIDDLTDRELLEAEGRMEQDDHWEEDWEDWDTSARRSADKREDAREAAVADSRPRPPESYTSALAAALTPAELAHYRLFLAGETTTRIAEIGGVSQGTVSKREPAILEKAWAVKRRFYPNAKHLTRADLGHRGRRRE